MKTIRQLAANMPLRVAAVILITIGGTCAILNGSWIWAAIALALLVAGVAGIISLHKLQMKKVLFLLDALENNDNAIRFPEQAGTKQNREINRLLNRVAHILQEAKTETARQEKYYELILSFINTGIMVLDDKGYVVQKNNELLRILGLEVFTHVRQLDKVDPELTERLGNARAGDVFQARFSNERETVNLAVRVSDITIREKYLRIFALNDINNELGERELDAWTRLIRVLTHEIMNSVTPIASLSDTLLSLSGNTDEEIRRGLQTISATGKGLLNFVESYRTFTRIPTPEPGLFYVKPFIERMIELSKHQHRCQRITFDLRVEPADLILYADENLIGQVVINLLKNAIEAIGDQPDGRIEIEACCNDAEEVLIEMANNGTPITPEVAEQIFIPFFSTKQGGSGIGLSLSRQIMRLSGGSIALKPTTKANLHTCFLLRFK